MELLIDIGNSYIKCGLFSNHKIDKFYSFKSNEDVDLNVLKNEKFDVVILSSVVNDLTEIVINKIKQISDAKIVKIKQLKKNIVLKVKAKKDEIGDDLYADLIALKHQYHHSSIVFDIGTVSKVLAIDDKGAFIGASFFSSFSLATRSMSNNTSLLPKISLSIATTPIGKDTIECINNGVYYSLLFAVKGFIKEYQKVLGKKINVIITGGDCILFNHRIKNAIIDPYLTLYGIHYIYQESK